MPKFNAKEAIEKFYVVMKKQKNYLCAAYLIGNIVCHDHTSSLEEIKLKILSKKIKIEALWEYIVNIPEKELLLKSKSNKKSLEAFKSWIMNDIELLKAIGKNNLIELGKTELNYTRIVFIALIQQHSEENNKAFIGFDYSIITQGSAQQTYACVRPIINQCTQLPVEAIKLLGSTNLKIAQDILYDLPPEHKNTKEIREFFYTKHEALRPKEGVTEKPKLTSKKTCTLIARFYGMFEWLFNKLKSLFKNKEKIPTASNPSSDMMPKSVVEIVIEPVIETLNNDIPLECFPKNRISPRHYRARNLP